MEFLHGDGDAPQVRYTVRKPSMSSTEWYRSHLAGVTVAGAVVKNSKKIG
jgi:hypothetical protein